MRSEPRWLEVQSIIVLHERSLALHGGPAGVRDHGLLESALARPANRFHYEGVDDVHALAATYLAAIVQNHPFVDGDKRTGLLAGGLFLRTNGRRLTAPQPDVVHAVLAVAAGRWGLPEVEAWMARSTAPLA